MKETKISDLLHGRGENYILPFFWQHGEDADTLIAEIDAIEKSGIKALCVESRTHEQFCEDGWWETMDLILSECESRDMKVWILDDKHFPSGYANGIIPKKYPDQAMWAITERHMDVSGPLKDAAVMYQWKTAPDDVLLGVIACKRAPHDERLTGETIDLTACLQDDMVYFDIPAGTWRVFFLFKSRSGFDPHKIQYCDKITPFGGDAYLEAVYEPHWEHYSRYFGNTLAGFFSDEPCFGNNGRAGFRAELGRKYSHFPYSDEVMEQLYEKLGGKALEMLPSLWFNTDDQTMQKTRVAYMDIITALYSKNFTYKLGDWCRAHGVEYIGHVIEDDHQHMMTQNSGGHFFRALDGQDMSGIDVVLCQIVPGMTDDINTVPCSYDVCDPDFYHFVLPKLGASHAHIQAEKQGRAMCEIYGAYGWAEGLKMMKWLTDFMLVRGINRYVPHAYTPKFPDPDCPPHMYAGGTNPQYAKFRLLMEYMNRVCHIFDGGTHIASAAVLYDAEAYWAGGKFMYADKPARYLTEHQLDYDIVPADYLEKAEIRGKTFVLAKETYPALVVPYAEYLSEKTVSVIARLASAGVPVYFIDGMPQIAETGKIAEIPQATVLALDALESALRGIGAADVTVISANDAVRNLRFYHYTVGTTQYYMLTNEGIHDPVQAKIRLAAFGGGAYAVYDPMHNTAQRAVSEDGVISLDLPPYASTVLVFGDLPATLADVKPSEELVASYPLEASWDIYLATQAEYPIFAPFRSTDTLFNITGRNGLPRFSGHMQYETTFTMDAPLSHMRVMLDLGVVGESASLLVNGVDIGDAIIPPYRFDITDALKAGQNSVVVEVTNHYGWAMRDGFSRYLSFEPSGLLGPVTIEIYRVND